VQDFSAYQLYRKEQLESKNEKEHFITDFSITGSDVVAPLSHE
jgi:hypothetical protein